jgi:V8-like Glu-specific endopeptidase
MSRSVLPRPWFALLALGVGCSDEAGRIERAATPIIGGQADTTHPAVIALARSDGSLCSAVVVGPRRALTAGHCVWGAAPKDLQLLVGADADAATTTIGVSRVVLYPTAQQSDVDLTGGVDLAALESEADFPVAPLGLAPATSTATLQGARVTLVGFGRTDPFDASSAGRRHAVTMPVWQACSRTLRVGDDATNVCFGDSGGAVLLDGALVAVVSAGHDGCDTLSLLTRLDAHGAWLPRIVNGALDAPCPECVAPADACDAPIEWVAPSPEPPVAEPTYRAGGGGTCAHSARTESHRSHENSRSKAAFGAMMTMALAAYAARRRAGAGSPTRRFPS